MSEKFFSEVETFWVVLILIAGLLLMAASVMFKKFTVQFYLAGLALVCVAAVYVMGSLIAILYSRAYG